MSQSKPSGITRAREGAIVPPTADEMTAHIIEAMTDGQWRTGKSHRELAEQWGVSINVVYDRATEAARFLRILVGADRESVVGAICAHLERLAEKAERTGDPQGIGVAVRAIEAKAKVLRLYDEEPRAAKGEATVANVDEATERALLKQRLAELGEGDEG